MKRVFEVKRKTFFLVSKNLDSRLKKQKSKNMSDIKPLKIVYNAIFQKIFKIVLFFQLKNSHIQKQPSEVFCK